MLLDRIATRLLLRIWLGLLTVLWAWQPWLLCPTRAVLILTLLATTLGALGWLTPWYVFVIWSGAVGLCNLTLALLLAAAPPNLWVGLSAGCTLLALLDGSHHFAHLRYCHLEPGVLSVLIRTLLKLIGLSLGAGVTVGILITQLPQSSAGTTTAGVITILGAGLLVGFLALFLLTTEP